MKQTPKSIAAATILAGPVDAAAGGVLKYIIKRWFSPKSVEKPTKNIVKLKDMLMKDEAAMKQGGSSAQKMLDKEIVDIYEGTTAQHMKFNPMDEFGPLVPMSDEPLTAAQKMLRKKEDQEFRDARRRLKLWQDQENMVTRRKFDKSEAVRLKKNIKTNEGRAAERATRPVAETKATTEAFLQSEADAAKAAGRAAKKARKQAARNKQEVLTEAKLKLLTPAPESLQLADDIMKKLTSELKSQRHRDDFLASARRMIVGDSSKSLGKTIKAQRTRNPEYWNKRAAEGPSEIEHFQAVKAEFFEEILRAKPDMNKAARLLDELPDNFRSQIERLRTGK